MKNRLYGKPIFEGLAGKRGYPLITTTGELKVPNHPTSFPVVDPSGNADYLTLGEAFADGHTELHLVDGIHRVTADHTFDYVAGIKNFALIGSSERTIVDMGEFCFKFIDSSRTGFAFLEFRDAKAGDMHIFGDGADFTQYVKKGDWIKTDGVYTEICHVVSPTCLKLARPLSCDVSALSINIERCLESFTLKDIQFRKNGFPEGYTYPAHSEVFVWRGNSIDWKGTPFGPMRIIGENITFDLGRDNCLFYDETGTSWDISNLKSANVGQNTQVYMPLHSIARGWDVDYVHAGPQNTFMSCIIRGTTMNTIQGELYACVFIACSFTGLTAAQIADYGQPSFLSCKAKDVGVNSLSFPATLEDMQSRYVAGKFISPDVLRQYNEWQREVIYLGEVSGNNVLNMEYKEALFCAASLNSSNIATQFSIDSTPNSAFVVVLDLAVGAVVPNLTFYGATPAPVLFPNTNYRLTWTSNLLTGAYWLQVAELP